MSDGELGIQQHIEEEISPLRADLAFHRKTTTDRLGEKLAVAALSAIPWVGGLLMTLASMKADGEQQTVNDLQIQWLDSHQRQLQLLIGDLGYVLDRINEVGEEARARAESPQYLALVRSAFRAWDRADTDEKRSYYAHLLANAAGTTLCPDDLVRLFIEWIDKYHETHFKIIRIVYQASRCTKRDIGLALFGHTLPRDDSAQAELFRELFRELNIGAIIHLARESDSTGQYLRNKPAQAPKGKASAYIETSFDATKQQVLSELGKQFVHYVMNEVVPRVS